VRFAAKGGILQVSWPTQSGAYVLQRKHIGFGAGVWDHVTNATMVVGTEYVISLPVSEDGELIRLRSE